MNGLQSSCSAFLQCTTELQELQGSILLYRHVSVLCQYSLAQCVNRDCPPALKKKCVMVFEVQFIFLPRAKGVFPACHKGKEVTLLAFLI